MNTKFKLGDIVDIEDLYDEVEINNGVIVAISEYNDDCYLIGWKDGQTAPYGSFTLDSSLYEAKKSATNINEFSKFFWVEDDEILTDPNAIGYNCISCNQHYPYAQANLPNNQLKCYSCRNG